MSAAVSMAGSPWRDRLSAPAVFARHRPPGRIGSGSASGQVFPNRLLTTFADDPDSDRQHGIDDCSALTKRPLAGKEEGFLHEYKAV
jgi:hypothetical protein